MLIRPSRNRSRLLQADNPPLVTILLSVAYKLAPYQQDASAPGHHQVCWSLTEKDEDLKTTSM